MSQQSSDVLTGMLGLLLLFGIGSCVLGGSDADDKERLSREEAARRGIEARRAADLARYVNDPLLTESARMSPGGDAISYTIGALGGRCGKLVSVTPMKTPMLYDVICSGGATAGQLEFTRYRLNTAAGIAQLLK